MVRTPPSPPLVTDGVATSSQSSFVLLNCSALRLQRVSMIYQICIKHLPFYKMTAFLNLNLSSTWVSRLFKWAPKSDTLKPASAMSASDTARRSRISFYLSADPPNPPSQPTQTQIRFDIFGLNLKKRAVPCCPIWSPLMSRRPGKGKHIGPGISPEKLNV